jgi:hypothetical protein
MKKTDVVQDVSEAALDMLHHGMEVIQSLIVNYTEDEGEINE